MANIKAKLKRDFPYYGEIKKAGEEILVDVQQVTRLVKRGIIEDPTLPKESQPEATEIKKVRGK
jgi:hypothetical protein